MTTENAVLEQIRQLLQLQSVADLVVVGSDVERLMKRYLARQATPADLWEWVRWACAGSVVAASKGECAYARARGLESLAWAAELDGPHETNKRHAFALIAQARQWFIDGGVSLNG